MDNKMMQRLLGKGLFFAVLVALVAVSFGNVASVHAENKPIHFGETVSDWIPSGTEMHWYKFDAGNGTIANITMTRTGGDLVPFLVLHYHDGNDFQMLAIDRNYDLSNSAYVSEIPVDVNDFETLISVN